MKSLLLGPERQQQRNDKKNKKKVWRDEGYFLLDVVKNDFVLSQEGGRGVNASNPSTGEAWRG